MADIQKLVQRRNKDANTIAKLRRETQQLTAKYSEVQNQLTAASDLQETLSGENQAFKEVFGLVRAELNPIVAGDGDAQSSLQGLAAAVRTKVEALAREVKKVADFRRLEEQFKAEHALSESRGQTILALTADLTSGTEEIRHLKQQMLKMQEQLDAAHQQTVDAIALFPKTALESGFDRTSDTSDACPRAKQLLNQIVALLEDEAVVAVNESPVEDWDASAADESPPTVQDISPMGTARADFEEEEDGSFNLGGADGIFRKLRGEEDELDGELCSDSEEDQD
jgi:hypothetical protein